MISSSPTCWRKKYWPREANSSSNQQQSVKETRGACLKKKKVETRDVKEARAYLWVIAWKKKVDTRDVKLNVGIASWGIQDTDLKALPTGADELVKVTRNKSTDEVTIMFFDRFYVVNTLQFCKKLDESIFMNLRTKIYL